MESLTIEIINPKAKKLLQSLEDLNLISISKSKLNLDSLLNTLRTEEEISSEEIKNEVESVRAKRQNG
ncbi:MAG TPA: hypothetical protein VFM79_09205 [Pelobium sp.]|nr:hypothetical protein [Pelobium sp.]